MNKTFENYNTITLKDMMEYIKENHPEDKSWFKSVSYSMKSIKDKEGNIQGTKNVYSHLVAKRAFCERYMPNLIPTAKVKEPKPSDELATW